MTGAPPLLAVPNVSEGRDAAVLDAIAAAFAAGGARVLDRHSDPDHHRTVFTLAGRPGGLHAAVAAGAGEAIARIDLTAHEGVHPRVGALDVAPIVHVDPGLRGAAIAEALLLADALGRLGLPVHLYGLLGGGRTRADVRSGRVWAPDHGPPLPHPTAGSVLVAARPPLIAFNVDLAPPATLSDARALAAIVRGLPGVAALGLELPAQRRVQVSTNLEGETTPRQLLDAIRRHARVASAELVALAPAAAFADWPADVPLHADLDRQLIEHALRSYHG